MVWETVVDHQFTILSDHDAQVIRSYGLVHPHSGIDGGDIALDTILFVDVDGRERWRYVSQTLPDLQTPEEVLARIRGTKAHSSRE